MSAARSNTTLVMGPVAALGVLLVAYGVLGLLFGGSSFSTADVPDGAVAGEELLGIEGNGWTNVVWISAGALLMLGAPFDASSRALAGITGLVLGAASVISLFTYWLDDRWGVFGVLAANNWTTLAWGVAALLALAAAMLPRPRSRARDEAVVTTPVPDERAINGQTARFGRERTADRERSRR